MSEGASLLDNNTDHYASVKNLLEFSFQHKMIAKVVIPEI
jgi:hypothetical protein